jgi:hypothetical protein
VDDVRDALGGPRERGGVEDVAVHRLDVGVRREVGVAQRVARQVVVEDDAVVVDQPAGERAADEAGAARDQHAFAVERHGGGEV